MSRPASLNSTGATIGMGKIGCRLRHAVQRIVERSAWRFCAKRVPAFEQIGENLCMIGGGALVMHAVRQNLFAQLFAEKYAAPCAASAAASSPWKKAEAQISALIFLMR